MVLVVGCPCCLYNPQGYRHREMSKAATCHISFNTTESPVVSHCLALKAHTGQHSIHSTQTFFLILGTEVSCVCL